MNDEKNLFSQFEEGSPARALLDSIEQENRFDISIICSLCESLSDIVSRNGDEKLRSEVDNCISGINGSLNNMMKMCVIYGAVANIADNCGTEPECIDIDEFLSDIVSGSSDKLRGVCDITFKSGSASDVCVEKNILEYIIISFMRYSVLNGAKRIDISNENKNDDIIVSIKITEAGKPADIQLMHETFSYEYAKPIIEGACRKINAAVTFNGNDMELTIPENRDETVMRSPVFPYGKKHFSMCETLLSDISNITII